MNSAHLHLIVNHAPLFLLMFGVAMLVWHLLAKKKEILLASVILFVGAGIGSLVSSQTGEGAEELVEHLPDVTDGSIHEHEEAAEAAQVLTLVVAGLALATLAIQKFRPQHEKVAAGLTFIAALVATSMMARTAYLGGMVRHFEIREGFDPKKELIEGGDQDMGDYEEDGDAGLGADPNMTTPSEGVPEDAPADSAPEMEK